MTTELRRTIEPSDVLAIEVECGQCHSRSVRRLDNWQSDIKMCPNCNTSWHGNSAALGMLQDIANRFWQLSNLMNKDLPFTVRFELRKEDQP